MQKLFVCWRLGDVCIVCKVDSQKWRLQIINIPNNFVKFYILQDAFILSISNIAIRKLPQNEIRVNKSYIVTYIRCFVFL